MENPFQWCYVPTREVSGCTICACNSGIAKIFERNNIYHLNAVLRSTSQACCSARRSVENLLYHHLKVRKLTSSSSSSSSKNPKSLRPRVQRMRMVVKICHSWRGNPLTPEVAWVSRNIRSSIGAASRLVCTSCQGLRGMQHETYAIVRTARVGKTVISRQQHVYFICYSFVVIALSLRPVEAISRSHSSSLANYARAHFMYHLAPRHRQDSSGGEQEAKPGANANAFFHFLFTHVFSVSLRLF